MTAFQDYILAAPVEAQMRLVEILTFVHDKLPNAEQVIYHGIPTFFVKKRDVINIGAYRDHLGVHVGYSLADYLKQKYPEYQYTKSAIQFLYTQPLPFDILNDICSQIKYRNVR